MGPNGPQHGIMGADATDYGLGVPESATPLPDISRERNMAKFSKTKEFQALKDTILARAEYWKQYQPGSTGSDIAFRDMPNEERGWRVLASSYIIEELNNIIGAYETANTVVADVKEAEDQRRQRSQSGA